MDWSRTRPSRRVRIEIGWSSLPLMPWQHYMLPVSLVQPGVRQISAGNPAGRVEVAGGVEETKRAGTAGLSAAGSPVYDADAGGIEPHAQGAHRWQVERGAHEGFDGANVRDKGDCLAGICGGEGIGTANDARTDGGERFTAWWGYLGTRLPGGE